MHKAIAAFMVDFGRIRRKPHCGKLIPATQLKCIVDNIMKRCLLDKPTLQREQYGRFLVIEQFDLQLKHNHLSYFALQHLCMKNQTFLCRIGLVRQDPTQTKGKLINDSKVKSQSLNRLSYPLIPREDKLYLIQ